MKRRMSLLMGSLVSLIAAMGGVCASAAEMCIRDRCYGPFNGRLRGLKMRISAAGSFRRLWGVFGCMFPEGLRADG